MEASFSKTVSEADIIAFVKVTGDKNAVHREAEYAATTIFRVEEVRGPRATHGPEKGQVANVEPNRSMLA